MRDEPALGYDAAMSSRIVSAVSEHITAMIVSVLEGSSLGEVLKTLRERDARDVMKASGS